MRLKFFAIIGVVAVLVGLGLIYVQAVASADPRLRACGGDGGNVRAAFAIARARDLQDHYPHMLRTPELETDSPAFVVDFDGETTLPLMMTNPRAPKASAYTNVVCVYADGIPNWYYDVDKSEMRR